MSVFIVHVTVWRCLPSDRFLYTPLHISEPTPSVLILSASSLTQTVAESMSIQFAKHFKWYVAALHYCSIFPSQWGRLLFSSDAHSTFSHVSYSFSYLLVLSGCILMKHSLKGNAYVCMNLLCFNFPVFLTVNPIHHSPDRTCLWSNFDYKCSTLLALFSSSWIALQLSPMLWPCHHWN